MLRIPRITERAANDLSRFGIEIPKIVSPGSSNSSLDGLQEEKAKLGEMDFHSRQLIVIVHNTFNSIT